MPLRLPLTSRKILEAFINIDVNTETVSRIVQRNQYLEVALLREIKALGLKDNTPTLKAAIALLGMQRVRDFLCALQIIRWAGNKYPKIDKDGKVDFRPSELLQYALRTEEFASMRRIDYVDTAYAAGMMFDIMLYLGKDVFGASRGYEEFVAEIFKHSLRAARIGTEIAKSFKNLGFSKYVFAACLIHDIGKLAMYLLYPPTTPNSYHLFLGDLKKKPQKREVAHFAEAKRFGATHEYYGAQMAYFFQLLRSIEKPLLFHHDPYLIRSNRDVFNFACLISLASNMANNFRSPKDSKDPVYEAWFTSEMSDFRVDPKLLLLIMAKIGSDRM